MLQIRNTSTKTRLAIGSKYVTQAQLQRPEPPTVPLTWHAAECKYKVHNLHQRYILNKGCSQVAYIPYISDTLGDTGVHRRKRLSALAKATAKSAI